MSTKETAKLKRATGLALPQHINYAAAFDTLAVRMGNPQLREIPFINKRKFIRLVCGSRKFFGSPEMAEYLARIMRHTFNRREIIEGAKARRAEKREGVMRS
ncbi:MAG: hypothetical protein KAH44_02555 [Oricola sp.]|nr:hypothetical protein [Oricola sp.]